MTPLIYTVIQDKVNFEVHKYAKKYRKNCIMR